MSEPKEVQDDDGFADPAQPGLCAGCHKIVHRTWMTSNDGRSWCAIHLKEVVRRAITGGLLKGSPE